VVEDPQVSVVVRSYNRLPTLCDLLVALQDQDHPSFEIVVVEQSTAVPPAAAARLADLARSPQIRLLRRPPLGGSGARNAGVRAARGEILVFIDDDDLPVGRDWLAAHVANYADPRCLGVTGRHRFGPHDEPSPIYLRRARTRCMGFMPLLKLPTTYARHGLRIAPVLAVHGTNGSLRRSAVDRFGGWDEDTTVEDETSFALRVQAGKRPDEYFVFDPRPEIVRGLGVTGGLDKRFVGAGQFYARLLDFVHTILGRYYPVRVALLYPVYLAVAYGWTVGWLWTEASAYRERAWPHKLAASVLFTTFSPFHVIRAAFWSWRKRRFAMTPERMRAAGP
jgi:glycosyltransferase involved in cell wall biosynthesis